MDRWVGGSMDRWIDGWMEGWMEGWTDEWMDGWMVSEAEMQRERDCSNSSYGYIVT